LPVIQGGGKAVSNQQAFRFRNDDGNETGATWMSPGNNVNQTIQTGLGNRFRIRFVVEETAAGTLNLLGRLHYSLDGGTYTELTTGSSYIRAIDSKNDGWSITDGDPTTQQIFTGTFVAGTFSNDGDCENATLTSAFTELEYCLYIYDATGSSTIDLRVYDSAAALDNYYQTPRVTVSEIAAQTVSLNTLSIESKVEDINVSPAAVSQTLDSLILESSAQSLDIPPIIPLNTLKLTAERPYPNIADIDFETGDLSEFDSVTDPDNDLSVTQRASMFGNWGMEVVIDDTNAVYGTKVHTGNGDYLRVRYYINPNGFTRPSADAEFGILRVHLSASPHSLIRSAIKYEYSTGKYYIRGETYEDDQTFIYTSFYEISNDMHFVEIEVYRSATNAHIKLWVDGVLKQTIDGLDINDAFDLVDETYFGAVYGVDAGTSGTIYFDKLSISGASLAVVPSFITVSPGVATTTLDTLILESIVNDLSVVTIGALSVALNSLPVESLLEDLNISPAAVSTSLDTLILNALAEALDIPPLILLNTLILNDIVENINVSPGAVISVLDTLALSSLIEELNISPAAVSTLLDTLILGSSAEFLSVVLGAAAIQLNSLILDSSAEDVSFPITIGLDSLTLQSLIQALNVSPGAVSTALSTLVLLSSTQDISIALGAASILLDTLELSTSNISLNVSPGAVSVQLDDLILRGLTIPLEVVTVGPLTITVDTLELLSNLQNATISPSAISITLDTLELDTQAIDINVLVGAVSILLNSLAIDSIVEDIVVAPGAVTSSLDTLVLDSSTPDISFLPGAVTTTLDTLEFESYADTITVIAAPLIVLLGTLPFQSQAVSLAIAPAGAALPLETLLLNSEIIDLLVAIMYPTVAGGVTISDRLISDILLSDTAISDISITDSDHG